MSQWNLSKTVISLFATIDRSILIGDNVVKYIMTILLLDFFPIRNNDVLILDNELMIKL